MKPTTGKLAVKLLFTRAAMLGSDTMIHGVWGEANVQLQFLLSLKKDQVISKSTNSKSSGSHCFITLCCSKSPASTFIIATLVAPLLLLSGFMVSWGKPMDFGAGFPAFLWFKLNNIGKTNHIFLNSCLDAIAKVVWFEPGRSHFFLTWGNSEESKWFINSPQSQIKWMASCQKSSRENCSYLGLKIWSRPVSATPVVFPVWIICDMNRFSPSRWP